MSKKHSFIEKEGYQFNNLPALYVSFHDKMFQYTENSLNVDVFLHFMGRVVDPLIHLEEEEQVLDFFSTADDHQCVADFIGQIFQGLTQDQVPVLTNYKKLRLKTRVVCFFYEKEDYKDEIKILKSQARVLAYR